MLSSTRKTGTRNIPPMELEREEGTFAQAFEIVFHHPIVKGKFWKSFFAGLIGWQYKYKSEQPLTLNNPQPLNNKVSADWDTNIYNLSEFLFAFIVRLPKNLFKFVTEFMPVGSYLNLKPGSYLSRAALVLARIGQIFTSPITAVSQAAESPLERIKHRSDPNNRSWVYAIPGILNTLLHVLLTTCIATAYLILTATILFSLLHSVGLGSVVVACVNFANYLGSVPFLAQLGSFFISLVAKVGALVGLNFATSGLLPAISIACSLLTIIVPVAVVRWLLRQYLDLSLFIKMVTKLFRGNDASAAEPNTSLAALNRFNNTTGHRGILTKSSSSALSTNPSLASLGETEETVLFSYKTIPAPNTTAGKSSLVVISDNDPIQLKFLPEPNFSITRGTQPKAVLSFSNGHSLQLNAPLNEIIANLNTLDTQPELSIVASDATAGRQGMLAKSRSSALDANPSLASLGYAEEYEIVPVSKIVGSKPIVIDPNKAIEVKLLINRRKGKVEPYNLGDIDPNIILSVDGHNFTFRKNPLKKVNVADNSKNNALNASSSSASSEQPEETVLFSYKTIPAPQTTAGKSLPVVIRDNDPIQLKFLPEPNFSMTSGTQPKAVLSFSNGHSLQLNAPLNEIIANLNTLDTQPELSIVASDATAGRQGMLAKSSSSALDANPSLASLGYAEGYEIVPVSKIVGSKPIVINPNKAIEVKLLINRRKGKVEPYNLGDIDPNIILSVDGHSFTFRKNPLRKVNVADKGKDEDQKVFSLPPRTTNTGYSGSTSSANPSLASLHHTEEHIEENILFPYEIVPVDNIVGDNPIIIDPNKAIEVKILRNRKKGNVEPYNLGDIDPNIILSLDGHSFTFRKNPLRKVNAADQSNDEKVFSSPLRTNTGYIESALSASLEQPEEVLFSCKTMPAPNTGVKNLSLVISDNNPIGIKFEAKPHSDTTTVLSLSNGHSLQLNTPVSQIIATLNRLNKPAQPAFNTPGSASNAGVKITPGKGDVKPFNTPVIDPDVYVSPDEQQFRLRGNVGRKFKDVMTPHSTLRPTDLFPMPNPDDLKTEDQPPSPSLRRSSTEEQ